MIRKSILLAGAALALISASLFAQTTDTKSTEAKPAEAKPAERASYEPRPPYTDFVTRSYVLANARQQNDANEIVIALRNMLEPWVKIYLDFSQYTIMLSAPPDQQTMAQKIIADLDRPQKSYRLTFTIAESDDGKRIGVQHFAVIVSDGRRSTLKQGSKVPVVTGTQSNGTSEQNQFQYLDIGMNFDLILNDSPNGLHLDAKIEQSSLADDHMTGLAAQDPIVRQTVLQDSALLTPGKPITLGSVDITGSTRHVDIEVIAEPVS
jgi:type II secretory pathway component GspD/PulD (secretin)